MAEGERSEGIRRWRERDRGRGCMIRRTRGDMKRNGKDLSMRKKVGKNRLGVVKVFTSIF